MKRSKVVETIAGWGDDTIRNDVYCCDLRDPEVKQRQLLEWADNLLYTLETEFGIKPPKYATCKKNKASNTLAVTEIDILNKNITFDSVYELCEINEWEPEDESK